MQSSLVTLLYSEYIRVLCHVCGFFCLSIAVLVSCLWFFFQFVSYETCVVSVAFLLVLGGGVASLEGDSLLVFNYLSASEIWLDILLFSVL
jgi:hypothetical protein